MNPRFFDIFHVRRGKTDTARAYLVGFFEVAVDTVGEHVFDKQRMRFVAHFEHVLRVDVTKALEGGLEIVEGLTQIALSREDDCLHAVVGVRHVLRLRHGQKTRQNLFRVK